MKKAVSILIILVSLCFSHGVAIAGFWLSPVYPQADAHVYSVLPNNNYGTNANLLVSKAFDSQGFLTQERQIYVKFDLGSLAGYDAADIVSVTLNLYVTTSSGGSVTAYHSGDAWTETGITWNNKPSMAGEPYMGISPPLTPNYQYYGIDLFSGGSGWLAGDMSDGYLSVALMLPSDVDENTTYYFSSKETNPAFPNYPYLEVQVVPEPATMLLLAAGAIVWRIRKI